MRTTKSSRICPATSCLNCRLASSRKTGSCPVPQAKEERVNLNEVTNISSVRESMAGLPGPLQPLLTWLTGKPLSHQRPIWSWTPVAHLATAILVLLASVAASIFILSAPAAFWPLLIVSWMLTVGAARKCLVMICHQCVHNNFWQHKNREHAKVVNRWVDQGLSTVLLLQAYDDYKTDHVSVHHSVQLATPEDPDVKFLLILGFLPGMTRKELWAQLVRTLWSLQFHTTFFMARLKANFGTAPRYRRMMAWVYVVSLLALVAATNTWLAFLVAWAFPLTVLYHISALLQFTSEHRWLQVKDPTQPGKLILARLTSGRFLGDPVPPAELPLGFRSVAWARWFLRIVFLHLPMRLFVLVGDLPQHDYHHRHPSSLDWPNAAYARQVDLDSGCPGWPEPYTEVWGLFNAIDATFDVLSRVPPLPDKLSPMPSGAMAEVMNGM